MAAKLELKLKSVTTELLGLQRSNNWDKDKWTDDSVLSDYFSAMANTIDSEEILFLGPSLTAAIKFGSPELVIESLTETDFYTCKYVFLCVSNSTDCEKEDTGSHWSLLFVDRLNSKAYHLDSLSPLNRSSAQIVANKLGYENGSFIEMPCMQQKQSFECGIHVLANAKYIAYHYCVKNILNVAFEDWCRGSERSSRICKVSLSKHPNISNNKRDTTLSDKYKTRSKQDKWQKTHKRNKSSTSKLCTNTQLITSNKFEILNKITEDENLSDALDIQSIPLTPPQSTSKSMLIKNMSSQSNIQNHTKAKQALKKHRVIISSDSHGRDLTYYLDQINNQNFSITNHCQPGAPIESIFGAIRNSEDLKDLTNNDFVVLLGGTNDITENSVANTRQFLKLFKDELEGMQSSFNHTNLILSTLPYRYDLSETSLENQLIKEVNQAIRQLSCSQPHIHLLDLWTLKRCYHTRHGLHINKRGKQFICKEIIKIMGNNLFISKSQGSSYLSESNQSPTLPPITVTNGNTSSHVNNKALADLSIERTATPILVTEIDMQNVIKRCKNDASIAFAHSISGDFEDPKQMGRGVALAFRKEFGRPERSECLNSHVTLQCREEGAAVYGLVTKAFYHSKPKVEDYNHAFHSLTEDFKARGFQKLICSPMGCVRDEISPYIFSKNIVQFYCSTGAPVDIIVLDKKSTNRLRNGFKHQDFVALLRRCIAEEMNMRDSPPRLAAKQNEQPYASPLQETPQLNPITPAHPSPPMTPVLGFSTPDLKNLQSQNKVIKTLEGNINNTTAYTGRINPKKNYFLRERKLLK